MSHHENMVAEPATGARPELVALRAYPEASTAVPPPAAARGWRRFRPFLLVGLGLLALGGAGALGWFYWTDWRFQVSTDDAYVRADNTTIAPRVAGYLSAVLVGDNETVRAGQVLARIDDRDFRVALEQARAGVAAAEATVANRQASIAAQQAAIESAAATIAADQANQTYAEQQDRRYSTLAASGFGSAQNAQQAAAGIAAARAAVARDTAALHSATQQLGVLQAELRQAQAALDSAQAAQAQAELNLSYTSITSPIAGVVGNRTLRLGQYVQAGTQLMAVVPLDAAYIVANFKETQLTGVRAGQPVSIGVDMFPGQVFRGRVDSVAPASGQEFALLPPDNATGNFTKVVQRIPVRITLDATAPQNLVLRPGMSVIPTIDTHPAVN